MNPDPPKFSVVVPACARPEQLAQCLARLAPGAQTLPATAYEVIVTDDSADEAVRRRVQTDFPWARWVAGPRRGPAANRNHGAAQARQEWVALVDDDCLPEPGWLKALADAVPPAGGAEPAALEGRTVADRPRKFIHETAPVNTHGGYLWSCNMAVRREVFAALGGFDERFPHATMEDVDFRERLLAAGHRFQFVPGAQVCHPWRTLQDGRSFTRYRESLYLYLRLHPEVSVRRQAWIHFRLAARELLRVWPAFLVRGRWRGARIELVKIYVSLGLAAQLGLRGLPPGRPPPRAVPKNTAGGGLKLLLVSNYFPDRNTGAQGTIIGMGEALAAAGNQVDFSWRNAPHGWWGHNFSRFFETPDQQLRQARAALAQADYDVVVVHQPHGYRIFEQLARRHPKCLFLNFSHGWELCMPSFAPASPSPWRRLKDLLATAMIRRHCERAARGADGVVVLNQLDAEFLTRHHGLTPAQICVLTPGLEPALLAGPVRAPAPPGQQARFLFIGNYVPQKGCEIMEAALLALARDNADFTFTCVTHADQHAGLRQRLGAGLGGRLTLLGWRPREALAELMRQHDYLLFPSRYEGFGKVAHEAMACGLAVIGTHTGVLAGHATHGENALVSPPGDLTGFLANVRTAAAQPALANTLGARSRAAVAGDTWESAAAQYLQFIQQRRAHKLLQEK